MFLLSLVAGRPAFVTGLANYFCTIAGREEALVDFSALIALTPPTRHSTHAKAA
ncbi:hypothetical protein M408DRAFT_329351 [Serendipita vermifera MAFF 305830]|uniref:Uncharacterized protein n=1 Tax=Serendipita vermifera MAFF 305830 TaxID=933852 RepID=A0A0C2WQW1_SERVB|nr:hypothetical protein M408DRAFT_329351 [Serendipita vermifera MAFF 305830]